MSWSASLLLRRKDNAYMPLIDVIDGMSRLYTDDFGQAHLRIAGTRGEKIIGRIIEDGANKVYFKPEKIKDIFRKTDAWSLNYALLRALNDDDVVNIKVREERLIYWLTVKECLELGDFLYFKTSGVERKIYIPRSAWHRA